MRVQNVNMSSMPPPPPSSEEDNDCPVCLDDYSETKHPKINCGCGFHACQECVKTYVLGSSTQPSCMDCKRIWTKSFQYDNLGKTFVNKTLKAHREKQLVEREKARFPDDMPRVKIIKTCLEYGKEVERLNDLFERFKTCTNNLFRRYGCLLYTSPSPRD